MDLVSELRNIFKKPNNGNVQIIFINVAVFLFTYTLVLIGKLSGSQVFFNTLIEQVFTLPSDFLSFVLRPWTIITYFFSHSLNDIWHIFGNMLVLYYFGTLFIDFLGQRRFISLYVLGGLAGGALYLLAYNTIPYYQSQSAVLVGASASALAIVTGIALHAPNYAFHLFGVIKIKIKWIAIFYAVSSYFGVAGSNSGGEIAHLGGVAMGLLFVSQMKKGRDLGRWISAFLAGVQDLFKTKPKMKAAFGGGEKREKSSSVGKPSQNQIDAILDKISKSGYSSLSAEEKKMLFQASNK